MKKNLLSILILALVIVNMAMTAFVLFSVMSTNAKTAALVTDILGALELEANSGMNGDGTGLGSNVNVAISDRANYNLSKADGSNMTFSLRPGADGGQHYAVVTAIVLFMNTSDPDYATHGTEEQLTANSVALQGVAGNVFSAHTLDELNADQAAIKQELLAAFQEYYGGSRFIYDVNLSGLLTQ